MTMTKSDPEREERRREQKEIAESLKRPGFGRGSVVCVYAGSAEMV